MLSLEQLHAELARAETLKQRWMSGQSTPLSEADIPPSWQPILNGVAPEKRALTALALLSQQQRLLIQLSPPENLSPRPALPDLGVPALPSALRPIFRRIMQHKRLGAELKVHGLLTLIWQRGHSVHPADWLPKGNDSQVPDVYWTWQRWAAEEAALHTPEQQIDADNWDDWYPAERVQQLRQLRAQNPAEARELIQTCALREPAEKRLRIVQVLSAGLSAEDTPYLEQLLKDRSKKIAQQASQYLARLDQHKTASEEHREQARELAEMYEWKSSGFFKKSSALLPRKLKNKQQQNTRSTLLEQVPLPALAEALGCTAAELLKGWAFDANRYYDNHALMIQAADGLSDDVLPLLLDRILQHLENQADEVALLHTLAPRLAHKQRQTLLLQLLTHKGIGCRFSDGIALFSEPLRELSWEALQKSAAWKSLSEEVKKSAAETARLDSYTLEQDLAALGLLLPADTAALALEALVGLGMMRADPCLDYLKLNAELTARC